MTIQLYSTPLPAMVYKTFSYVILIFSISESAACLTMPLHHVYFICTLFWYYNGVVFVKVLWTGTVFLQIPMPDVITDALTGQAEMEIFVFIAWELGGY